MHALSLSADNSSLSSALHWRDCRPHAVLRPTSTGQVAGLVRALHLASSGGRGTSRRDIRSSIGRDGSSSSSSERDSSSGSSGSSSSRREQEISSSRGSSSSSSSSSGRSERDSSSRNDSSKRDSSGASGSSSSSSRRQRFSVRASRQGFHSTNNFSCASLPAAATAAAAAAAGDPPSVYSVVLDMTSMSQLISLDSEVPSVTVQAGMTFEALELLLFKERLGLPTVYLTPTLAGMSLGAALVTAAHGSALQGQYATLAPYVRSAVYVDGTGEVRVVPWPGQLLEGSLGLLGVVTELTLTVAPRRKVRVSVVQAEDTQMVGDIREIMEHSAALSLDVSWSPAAGMYTARVWHGADEGEAAASRNTFMQAPAQWLDKLDGRLHHDQEDLLDQGAMMCELLGDMSNFPYFKGENDKDPPPGLIGVPPKDAYVGWLAHMASSRCPEDRGCVWGRARWTPHELGISADDLGAWVEDARRVMAQAHSCPGFVITLRFVPGYKTPASDTSSSTPPTPASSPMAMHSGRALTVAIDISTLGSLSAPRLHVKQQHLLDELLQMTQCRYEGRPHWGSGTNRLFTGPCPVRDMYGPQRLQGFLAQRPAFDPSGLFLPPLFARVIGRRGGDLYPGCAVDDECFCQEDAHCGLHHTCVPGAVFPEFNVCAPQGAALLAAGKEL